ncbi:hypothetical protein OCV67_07550 [Porcipelethomonas ammoniilytica]|uniref:hypothetical protein n=1 Tax=Porcipelethomonas ammoniilytica TaxID=2981722 RepID=UPI000820A59F|nr:hypothetical protein [Porcipelethomonas ammoniilytica]MCU6719784.1 hypothetical protein [Porcipelethomonas ammoniilytica]SCI92193.1 Uncharacterised protein [uncultured Ruminococcus sp.]
MEKFILFFPVIIGVILDVIGGFLYFKRKKFGIHVIGTVTGIAKSQTKYAGVKVTTEAPIVKYDIADQTYTAPSAKFYPEGTTIFKKGNSISIKVSRKNHRSFVPEENGSTAEKILFSCGTFMIIAFCIMYFRYY